MMLNRMTHVVISIMIILVLVGILGDAVSVMVSESSNINLHSDVAKSSANLPHVHLVGVDDVIVLWKRVLRATHHQNTRHEL